MPALANAAGAAPKSIHNMHGLLSSAMTTAVRLGYIDRNPCQRIPLPAVERIDDAALFLTHAEYKLLLDNMDQPFRAFTQFLVMTGIRFGEASTLTVADINLLSNPPTARINKAWKRDGQSSYDIGPTPSDLTPPWSRW
ncbi:hypothetical protein [Paenarthrobacter sp. NPDC090522]|uniref:hypothetical protein n=1 Tax=Paenarthrobacter sp. NPDC090522 TaxID=3364383 RepID=UPI003812392E